MKLSTFPATNSRKPNPLVGEGTNPPPVALLSEWATSDDRLTFVVRGSVTSTTPPNQTQSRAVNDFVGGDNNEPHHKIVFVYRVVDG